MSRRDRKVDKIMNFIIGATLAIIVVAILTTQSGCAVNEAIATNLEEEEFILGCKAVRANVDIGYLSQAGEVGVPCKVKCSKKLPPNYCFRYVAKTPYGECDARVGPCVYAEHSHD